MLCRVGGSGGAVVWWCISLWLMLLFWFPFLGMLCKD
jgi:hypothetical protein